MPSNEYHFVSRWRVTGTADEVYTIIDDAESLPRWWPSVYLQIEEAPSAGFEGVGRTFRLLTKGWLPYQVRWSFRATEKVPSEKISLRAFGDLEGQGIWTFSQNGDDVDIVYDWRIVAEKPLLRWGSLVFKPLLAANHRWAMAQGEKSLRLELARRRAATLEARECIPNPPGPTSYGPWLVLGAIGLLIAAVSYAYSNATCYPR